MFVNARDQEERLPSPLAPYRANNQLVSMEHGERFECHLSSTLNITLEILHFSFAVHQPIKHRRGFQGLEGL